MDLEGRKIKVFSCNNNLQSEIEYRRKSQLARDSPSIREYHHFYFSNKDRLNDLDKKIYNCNVRNQCDVERE